jgi:plasmid stabilization system protein ParE
MAERVVWSPEAAASFEKIVEYIAVNSHTYAALFAGRVLESVANLEFFPNMGRVVPEYSDNHLRELFQGNYRIVYRIKNSLIEIVALSHTAQLRVDFN